MGGALYLNYISMPNLTCEDCGISLVPEGQSAATSGSCITGVAAPGRAMETNKCSSLRERAQIVLRCLNRTWILNNLMPGNTSQHTDSVKWTKIDSEHLVGSGLDDSSKESVPPIGLNLMWRLLCSQPVKYKGIYTRRWSHGQHFSLENNIHNLLWMLLASEGCWDHPRYEYSFIVNGAVCS